MQLLSNNHLSQVEEYQQCTKYCANSNQSGLRNDTQQPPVPQPQPQQQQQLAGGGGEELLLQAATGVLVDDVGFFKTGSLCFQRQPCVMVTF